MKEKEFIKKFPKGKIEVGIYYSIDDNEEIVFDEDSMKWEFDFELEKIKKFITQDELELMVREKIEQIENKNKK